MGSSGSFVAIILSVPLTVVALVGVVGVPKIQEMIGASTSHGDDDEGFDRDGFGPRSRSRRGSSRDNGEDDLDADLWADSELEASFSAGKDDENSSEFDKPSKSSRGRNLLARNQRETEAGDSFNSELDSGADDDGLFRRPSRGRFGQTPKEPDAIERVATDPFKSQAAVMTADLTTPATPATQGRTGPFASAVGRLRTMGIQRFHLEPGLEADHFLFVCQVNDPAEPAMIHRFEAESADPAGAVNDVLQQVTQWQSSRAITAGGGLRR